VPQRLRDWSKVRAFALRTAMPPEQMENTLRATVRSIDPQLPLNQVQTMEHAISDSEAPRRFNTALIASFAAIAVLLAVLGIYSVIAFSVAQRMQEMAIRMALGSQRWGIVRLVVISGAKLAAVGCAIGLAGAFAASYLLRSFLFGVSAVDPLVLTLAAVSLLLLTLAASLLPGRPEILWMSFEDAAMRSAPTQCVRTTPLLKEVFSRARVRICLSSKQRLRPFFPSYGSQTRKQDIGSAYSIS
jgi:hypothetical protein